MKYTKLMYIVFLSAGSSIPSLFGYTHKISNLTNEKIAVKISYAGGGHAGQSNHTKVIKPGDAIVQLGSVGYCLSQITIRIGNDVDTVKGPGLHGVYNRDLVGGKLLYDQRITGLTCAGFGVKVLPGGAVKIKRYPSDKWMMQR